MVKIGAPVLLRSSTCVPAQAVAIDDRLLITRCPLDAIRSLERGHPDGEGWNAVAFMGLVPSERQIEELKASDGILTEEYFLRLDASDSDEMVGKMVKDLASSFALHLIT